MPLSKKLRLGLIIALVIYGVGFSVALYWSFSASAFVPIPSRQITQNSLHLQEVWRRHDVHLTRVEFPATDAIVVLANYDQSSLQYQLYGLNEGTGDILWDVVLPRRVWVNSLIIGNNQLYVATSGEIQAYQLSNGQLIWRTPGKPSQRSSYRLAWFDENVINYSTVIGEDYQLMSTYDATTGNLVQQKNIPINPMPLLTTSEVEYAGECGKLYAIDRQSGGEIWHTQLSGCPQRWSVLVGSYLLVATYKYPGSIAGLHLINAGDGKLIWYALEDDLISNFAVIDKTVYAIRRNGDIVGLNLDTGQEVGTIKFDTNQANPNKHAYWLAANDHKLFVYYGDSRELIAFQH